ncbi:MAG: AMIN domain-containing protein [Leptolyngbyaceae cyanobacterium]
MKRLLGYGSCLAGSTLLALVAQPALATTTMITGIQVIPTDGGAQIVLETEAGDVPQVFAVNQGNTLRADIVRTQLQLADGGPFTQQDPAPGIASITLNPLDGNSVRLTVDGSDRIPMGTVGSSSNGGIIIDVEAQAAGTVPQATGNVPDEIETVPGEPEIDPLEATPGTPDATVAQAEPETEPLPEPTGPQPDVLVPNPEVVIDGVPVPAPEVQAAPPFLPSAVAPPVGDIAVSETVPDFGGIDLGTGERVPRLVLRDAPSREVLNLLARAADLNLVFIDANGEETEGAAATGEGPPITLDIENESVQSVFNSVLRVTGLQANRVGRTIYVGPNLPASAQNTIVRTLRLNQIDADVAASFLVGLGAESQVTFERRRRTVETIALDEDTNLSDEFETEEFQEQTESVEATEALRTEFQDTNPILRGLIVLSEERTNSITLSGTPELVAFATQQLTRLDLRRRQVAINVKVIDINLNAIDAFGTSFSFSLGDINFLSDAGVGIINFGESAPNVPETSNVPSSIGAGPSIGGSSNFLLQLIATVQEGNGKILTDPTLIIQEGQQAAIQLTEDVVTNITTTFTDTDGGSRQTQEFELTPAGLVLGVDVQRIDDNGFVSLSVAPSLTAPVSTFDTGEGSITLLSDRQLQSGIVRVRDGQTLLLSGIIQESDRTTITKVPILGDLPLIGALFRNTSRDNQRQELIILVTPEILDDSDQSAFGYSYTPSDEVQELLERSQ